jgi:UDP:flavonoid glycosyltransferase YjiC (YdhE family)
LKIVFATFGSLGDLHPYLPLAHEARARGHHSVVATGEVHRAKVEGEGLEFHPIRPEMPAEHEIAPFMARLMDGRRGTECVIRELMAPAVRQQYADLEVAARNADFLVSHPITYAAPLLAEKHRIPWAATALQPIVFASVHDPPVPPSNPPGAAYLKLPAPAFQAIFRLVKGRMRGWTAPVEVFRRELGLPPGAHPIFEGQFSPALNLALFSRCLAAPQRDWPAKTLITGFPFYDRAEPGIGMPAALERFLSAGPAPIVFTLGSSAVAVAGDFYRESLRAGELLGRRVVLLIGRKEWNALPELPEWAFACDYAPHGELFPRAAAIVHQGGVGTTGQGMRSGRPVLIVPFAHDQPDNAHRIRRRGCGLVLDRRRYRADRVAGLLRRLIEIPSYAERAQEVARIVGSENAPRTALDAIERLLNVR